MKLGPHLQTVPTSQVALAWAARAPIVKAIDSPTVLRHAQPGAIKVFRRYFKAQPLTDPGVYVREIVEALGGYNDPNLYVELLNECYQDGPDLTRYCEWTAQATEQLHWWGLKVCGFGFSTGNPTIYPDAWQYLKGQNYAGVDAIGLHQYWDGRSRLLTDWNALRHRLVHGWTGGVHPLFIITECGADAVDGGPSGWKLCGITGDQYVLQLAHFEAELERDDYVLGATVFGASPAHDWTAFSTDDLDTHRFSGLPSLVAKPPEGDSLLNLEEMAALQGGFYRGLKPIVLKGTVKVPLARIANFGKEHRWGIEQYGEAELMEGLDPNS